MELRTTALSWIRSPFRPLSQKWTTSKKLGSVAVAASPLKPERESKTCPVWWRRSILTSHAVMKVSCEPSSISILARKDTTWEQTVATAVLRKTNSSDSVVTVAMTLGDDLEIRHPVWEEVPAPLSEWRLVWCGRWQWKQRKRDGQSLGLVCPELRQLRQSFFILTSFARSSGPFILVHRVGVCSPEQNRHGFLLFGWNCWDVPNRTCFVSERVGEEKSQESPMISFSRLVAVRSSSRVHSAFPWWRVRFLWTLIASLSTRRQTKRSP